MDDRISEIVEEVWDDACNAVCQMMIEKGMCRCPEGKCYAALVEPGPGTFMTAQRIFEREEIVVIDLTDRGCPCPACTLKRYEAESAAAAGTTVPPEAEQPYAERPDLVKLRRRLEGGTIGKKHIFKLIEYIEQLERGA